MTPTVDSQKKTVVTFKHNVIFDTNEDQNTVLHKQLKVSRKIKDGFKNKINLQIKLQITTLVYKGEFK